MSVTRPVNLQIPFANSGSKNTIPVASQIGITPGAASFTDGFVPLNMTPLAAGGVPPSGLDMNGILNILSQHTAFQNAGGVYQFDATLAAAIGGYPVGHVLQSDDGLSSYVNILAGNTTNFNTTPASIGVSWLPYAGQSATQSGLNTYAFDTGTANTITAALSPVPAALVDGMVVRVLIKTANTAATTLNLNTLGAKQVMGLAGLALQGGELSANARATFLWSATANSFVLLSCENGSLQVAPATKSSHAVPFSQLPSRNYVSGLTLSNNATNPNTQIDVSAGGAVDATNVYSMTVSATLTKTLQASGTWAAGTGNNGLFSGARANSTWYHVFLIRKTSDGSIDVGFDTSVTAANIPAGYSAYRRIGSIFTDGSSNIRAFSQFGDEFLWVTPTRDINVTGAPSTAANYAVTVPPGVIVEAVIQGYTIPASGSASVNLNTPGLNDVAAIACPTFVTPTTSGASTPGRAYIRTNTAQQIQIASSAASNTHSYSAYGWRDSRGKNS